MTASKHTTKNAEILPNFLVWKFFENQPTASAEFRANRSKPKLCGNYVFPENFHTKKLGELTVFYAVTVNLIMSSWSLY